MAMTHSSAIVGTRQHRPYPELSKPPSSIGAESMPTFQKPARVLLLSAALAILPAIGARAQDTALPADSAALQACLALAQKNEAARGTHGSDELAEKTGPKGQLDAARDAARSQPESCIGVVSTACIQAEGNNSTAVMVDCYGREANAWDGRLNAAYKKALKTGDGEDVAEGFRKVQRTWIAFRDAACAQPDIVFKGTMARPMEAYAQAGHDRPPGDLAGKMAAVTLNRG